MCEWAGESRGLEIICPRQLKEKNLKKEILSKFLWGSVQTKEKVGAKSLLEWRHSDQSSGGTLSLRVEKRRTSVVKDRKPKDKQTNIIKKLGEKGRHFFKLEGASGGIGGHFHWGRRSEFLETRGMGRAS